MNNRVIEKMMFLLGVVVISFMITAFFLVFITKLLMSI